MQNKNYGRKCVCSGIWYLLNHHGVSKYQELDHAWEVSKFMNE